MHGVLLFLANDFSFNLIDASAPDGPLPLKNLVSTGARGAEAGAAGVCTAAEDAV